MLRLDSDRGLNCRFFVLSWTIFLPFVIDVQFCQIVLHIAAARNQALYSLSVGHVSEHRLRYHLSDLELLYGHSSHLHCGALPSFLFRSARFTG